MSEKIVFFDIDGTLLDEQKRIPISTREAIKELLEQDILIAIATGRAPFMFEDIRKELEIETFISFNGQYVVSAGEVAYKNPLKKERIQELEEVASNNKHPMVFLDHMGMRTNHHQHPHIIKSMDDLKMFHPDYDPSYYHDREIFQALLFCENQHELSYRESYHDLDFIRWHDYSMDVLPSGGSKAKGIEQLIKQLGILPENTYAFGDALNDIEMLKFAGTGIAMGNGMDEVKQVADFVTKDVSENGIKKGLMEVGLLKGS
ncbi:Cof-type HAD-IIB family hydrolase [Pseudalkalibacillus caeni]|uniref:Cof-type HAD-IIB family hydrolase n=1 Tax=Exobacillus caeni TaxID=2574798 RepID=A0A5R9F3W8_9BACL|nr:Cof-type HAD-IIB family hydrolase [Pseudalkalibacillus caeni]TLS37701.1 Cof-type HAD-IIB family hydrolase [Pseudalkalibacillus caeni]